MNVALRLAILRTVRYQQHLVPLTGIPPYRLSRIVNGWVRPTDVERARIAAALGEPEAALFSPVESDAMKPQTPTGAHAHA